MAAMDLCASDPNAFPDPPKTRPLNMSHREKNLPTLQSMASDWAKRWLRGDEVELRALSEAGVCVGLTGFVGIRRRCVEQRRRLLVVGTLHELTLQPAPPHGAIGYVDEAATPGGQVGVRDSTTVSNEASRTSKPEIWRARPLLFSPFPDGFHRCQLLER